MKSGQFIYIYTDPIEKKGFEGRAELIEKLGDYEQTELWIVLFDYAEAVVGRHIKKDKKQNLDNQ